MKQVELRKVKQGQYFTLSEIDFVLIDSKVWVRGAYDRSTNTYSCYKYSDVNQERFWKGSKKVYIDFCF